MKEREGEREGGREGGGEMEVRRVNGRVRKGGGKRKREREKKRKRERERDLFVHESELFLQCLVV